MERSKHLTIKRLKGICKRLDDPRRPWGNKRHELIDVIVIVLLGIICGCETWQDIRDYGTVKRKWLRSFLKLPNGIPSEATFRRLIATIRAESLERIYREWVRPYVGGCYGKQVCIDGKSVRGTNRRGAMKLHMISMWVREDGISLGQIKTEEKSNEITAIPQLLDSVDIRGSIVTIDAMGCQREIAKNIIEKEANYVLAVKKNQPTLHDEITEYFQWALQDEIEGQRLDRYMEKSFDHGKNITWKLYSTKDTVWFESKHEWASLRTFFMIERIGKTRDEITIERAFYISSLEADAKDFLRYARGHWSVENQLHWMLDVAFREDACLIHQANAPQNLALFRKMALTLIKQDTTYKASVRRKQKMAGWDNDYALSIIS